MKQIQFIDLKAQQDRIRPQIDEAIKRVLDHGKYIMGPEVKALEEKLAKFCGAKHAITCANGTDALQLVLMAQGIGPGDAVFLPSFTFTATPEVVALLGAEPVFVDVLPDTFNMDPDSLQKGIQAAREKGLTPRGVIPVDIFGQPADYDILEPIAQENDLWILCDAAQSFGGSYKGRKIGSLGDATATSFFPAKPLGCYGDGGCVFTNDDKMADTLRSLRVHGKGTDKYDNVRIGVNSRLDTIQAAILLEKLKIFQDELEVKKKMANAYSTSLTDFAETPVVLENCTSAWAQYTLVLPEGTDRGALQTQLKEQGIPTAVYYPMPLHQQEAYKNCLTAGDLNVSEDLSTRVLSLPMSGYLKDDEVRYIVKCL
ncbi:MAG TPA: aminotransferase DegT [Holosporales bacterium]|nr:aminotransferase DegT [Holosporales bacterium]